LFHADLAGSFLHFGLLTFGLARLAVEMFSGHLSGAGLLCSAVRERERVLVVDSDRLDPEQVLVR
jgi:hypothetical protein